MKQILQAIGVILVGVAVAATVVTLGEYSRDHWVPSFAALSLGVFTAITFVAVLFQFKRQWHRWTFWLTTAGLLCVHLTAYTALLTQVPEWRLPWFTIVCIAETPLLCSVLYRIGFRV